MRETIIAHAMQALQGNGFTVSSFIEFNSCFDIAAKKNHAAYVIKVLSNVDSLRADTAFELHKAATLFDALPLIIGEKTKATDLQPHTQYERFGIPVLSVEMFGSFLAGENPRFHSFKGKRTVQLDTKRLVDLRQQHQLSQQELAGRTGVSPQTIHRYENGAAADATDAQKIEAVLGHPLIVAQPIMQIAPRPKNTLFENDFSDTALEKLHDLGMPLALFEHAPFLAFGNPTENLLINLGKEKRDIRRKALVLEKTKTVFKAHSIVISKEYKLHSIGKTPIIQEAELESFSRVQELLHEIEKREKNRK
ncbi:MAG: helix-turn-helix domain-containing protein [Candidatus Diapherotrites archaeon]|nr:helix-turn-helix domain-containing protein [Candidatus Diapherotrites archaeon]